MLILIIAGGPDKGRIYELLEGKDIILGREGDQVKLNDRKVSREHAKLWCEGGQWYLQDLGSRHGTHRNHQELEKGATAKLKDGDYIQVGSTVMVMGRMPAEHAERLAMLGMQSADVPGWRKPGVLVAGGVAATVALLGLTGYGVYKMDLLSGHNKQSDSQFAQLQQALIESQQQNAEATRQLQETLAARSRIEEALMHRLTTVGGELDAHADAVAQATDELYDINRPLLAQMEQMEGQAREQQIALERIGEMLAHEAQRDNSEAVMALLTELKTEFAGQPDGDELVRRLSMAIANNAEATGQAVRSALAEFRAEDTPLAAAERTEALVARVLTALESVPSSTDIAQEVLAGIGNPYAAQEAMMREILAEYRGTRETIEQTVASAMNEDASQAQRLMVQVMDELGKQPDGEQLAAQLRDAMEQAASGAADADANLAALMQQVLTEFENRPTAEQLAAELREAVGEDAQRTQQLMAQVLEELASQPTAEQNAQQTAQMMQAILARIDEQNELAGEVAQLRAMIQDRPEGSDALIEAAIARLDQQSRNSAQLLEEIAQLRAAMPADVSDQLDQVLTKLDEQVRGEQVVAAIEGAVERIAAQRDQDTFDAIDAIQQRLAALPSAEQLESVIDSQESLAALLDTTDARAALGELRAALDRLAEAQPESENDRLDQILAMLEERERVGLMLAEMHDLLASQPEQAQAMREELLAAIRDAGDDDTDRLLEQLLSEVQSRLTTDDALRQAIREEMAGSIQPGRMALQDGHDVAVNPGSTPGPGPAGTDADDPPAGQRLSALEQAYRDAFETGTPITVGAGIIDPTTGQVSEGRRLDPAIAKALGYTTWRNWYLADMHAERMRLQHQAQRDRNAADADAPPGIVTLPGPDESAAPQDDEDADE
ncbi:MAG: FHA domain-containing protein [Phycisphaerales bacterium JB063]